MAMQDHEVIAARAGSRLPHVGGYRRVLPVSLERVYENALDWQHLPHVHRSRFASIRCHDYGSWGWRAEVRDPDDRASTLELVLDRSCRRWVTTVIAGFGAGAEIWTHAFPMAERRVDLVIDFFVPEVAESDRVRVGQSYAALYAGLYDEDVAMMVERQRQLDRRIDAARGGDRCVDLGARDGLSLPMVFELGGREFVLAAQGLDLVAYPARCPHQLGPLVAGARLDGTVVCPWHGYRFDLNTGENVSGGACRLVPLPRVEMTAAGRVAVHWE
jgi:nitrite reductase/ring-hydroxylating ferredoxin subunit